MTLAHLAKHPLFLLALGAAGTLALSTVIASEVGKARDSHQDEAISAVKADVSHVKIDGDKTSMDVARLETRVGSVEEIQQLQYQELTKRVESLDDCVRTACWRRADR